MIFGLMSFILLSTTVAVQSESAAVEQAWARFVAASSPAEATRAADELLQLGVGFDAIYARL